MLLATLLIQYDRLRGVQSSGVLIIFWFLCVVCAIIPFRSRILLAMAKVRGRRGACQGQPCLGDGLRAQGHCWVLGCPSPAPRTSPSVHVVPYLLHLCQEAGWGPEGEAHPCSTGEWGRTQPLWDVHGRARRRSQPRPPPPSAVWDTVSASVWVRSTWGQTCMSSFVLPGSPVILLSPFFRSASVVWASS